MRSKTIRARCGVGVPAERFDDGIRAVSDGKEARNVHEAAALSYVLGYCIGHAPALRPASRSSQWIIARL